MYDECSNHQAELLAICAGISYIENAIHGEKYIICTDSQSAIADINSRYSENIIVFTIRAKYKELVSNNIAVSIMWVKAHCGIQGNELADQDANEAADLDLGSNDYFDLIPISLVKTSTKKSMWCKWIDYAFKNEKPFNRKKLNSWISSLLKKPTAIGEYNKFYKLVEYIDYYTKQIMNGHGCFGSYLHKFKLRNNNLCPTITCYSGESGDDVEHTIFECVEMIRFTQMLEDIGVPNSNK